MEVNGNCLITDILQNVYFLLQSSYPCKYYVLILVTITSTNPKPTPKPTSVPCTYLILTSAF